MTEGMTIGLLASQVGLTSETLRYYERLGLIAPSQRTESNYRLYDAEAAQRLFFIRRAQVLGFSLQEIGQLLSLRSQPESDMSEVKALAEAKIRDIQAKIDDLVRMQKGLAVLTETCPGHGSTGNCPILDALSENEDVQSQG
ncbi:MAG: heavy metal-responsive transcriptional regulator [Gammaproteobacteria bacterium]|nr:heavy metal-responsive transcriptional regulator [Gammaproteobacteria bacterium]